MNFLNKNSNVEDLKELLHRIEALEARLDCLESALASQPESPSTEPESPAEAAVEVSPLAPAAEAAPAVDCSEKQESLKSQITNLNERLKQSNERSKELVQKLEEMEPQLEKKSEEIRELEGKIESKNKEIESKNKEIESKDEEIRKQEDNYQFCYNQYKSYKEKHSEAELALSEMKEKLDDAQKRVEKVEGERDDTRRQLDKEKEAHDKTREKLNATQSTLERTEQDLASRKVLSDRLWPDCLRIPALADYAAVWHEELSKPSADPILLSMFANIFSWACAHEVAERGEGDNSFDQAAIVSLYTFSRFFFEWLYRHGTNPEKADRLSHALSSHINSKLEASNRDYRIETEEVQLGDPYESKRMMPSPRGTSTGEVASIESWCIMNRSGSVCHKKAQVCLG